MGVVNLKIVAFAHQGAHHVLGHGSLLRAAGQHALQLLRAHLVVHLHARRLVAAALHAEGELHDSVQQRRHRAPAAVVPAAGLVPISQPVDEVRGLKLVVIEHCQPSRRGRVEGRQHHARVLRKRILPAAHRLFQLFPIRRRLQRLFLPIGLSVFPQRRLNLGHLQSLRIPADERAAAEGIAVVAHQPFQRVVRLLRGDIAYRGRLARVRKASQIGEIRRIVARDDLGVSVHRHHALEMLRRAEGLLAGEHAQTIGHSLAALEIELAKAAQQSEIRPHRAALLAHAVHNPAHHVLFVLDRALFVHLKQPGPGKVGLKRSAPDVIQNRVQLGASVSGIRPLLQLLRVESEFFLVARQQIADLLAQRMRRRLRPGTASRFLRRRNDDLLVHRPSLHESAIRVQRDFNLRLGGDVPHRREGFPVLHRHARPRAHRVVGFQRLLHQSHPSTSANSPRPVKLPSPKDFISISCSSL